MLILEDFGEDSLRAGGDAGVVYGSSTTVLNTHSSSMNCIELVLCVVGSR